MDVATHSCNTQKEDDMTAVFEFFTPILIGLLFISVILILASVTIRVVRSLLGDLL